jgi:hypothetical protein
VGLACHVWCDRKVSLIIPAYHTKFHEGIKLIGIPEFITWSYVRWFHKHSGKVLTTTETMVNDLRAVALMVQSFHGQEVLTVKCLIHNAVWKQSVNIWSV